MKKLSFILLLFISSQINAQVGGISASKLATLGTATVSNKSLEFEPMFGFGFSNSSWDSNGVNSPLTPSNDSTLVFSSFGFRFSYGVINNLEIGISLPVDMSRISLGLKYKLPFETKYSLGVLAGLNSIIGNSYFNNKKKTFDNTPLAVGGIVMTYEFNDKLSIDFDAQLQKYLKKIDDAHKNDLFLNSDIGYYITEGFQLALGFHYLDSQFDDSSKNYSLGSLNPGITIERAENFLIVLNMPIDVFGKNIEKTISFGFALTITLE